MKKITIIFIIVFCLLSFMEISCLAQEPYNYGKIWNSWSDYTRSIYIMGLKDGLQRHITFSFLKRLMMEEKDIFDKYLKESEVVKMEEMSNGLLWDFILSEDEVIRNVVTDLYKDLANIYLSFYDICGIAHKKLKGESIESLLRELRERIWLIQKFNME